MPSADDPGVIFLSKHLSLKIVWGITTEMTPVSPLMTPVSQGHGLREEASEFWMGTSGVMPPDFQSGRFTIGAIALHRGIRRYNLGRLIR
jgi:hypothetical protein